MAPPRKTLDEIRETAEENHPGITSLLGARSDPDVAEYYELSVCRIQRLRTQLAISPFGRKKIYLTKPGPSRLEDDELLSSLEGRHPGISSKLGVVRDNQIASDYGLSPQRIFHIRKRLSIHRAPRNASGILPSR